MKTPEPHETPQIHSIDEVGSPSVSPKKDMPSSMTFSVPQTVLIFALAVLLGGVGGYALTSFSSLMKTPAKTTAGAPEGKKAVKSVGVVDKKTFKDSAEGILRVGGTDGDGSYYLERAGGEDQRAYLTSSAVDMSQFVGKKVRVWGQTFQGQKAGWLMDVGLVELLE